MSGEDEVPLEVEQIECAPLGRAKVVIRVTGRWRARWRPPDARAFLIVEAEGRRHRFPAMPEPRRPRLSRPASWSASFAVPSWLEPPGGGEMSLWFGNVEIPLPEVSVDAAARAAPVEREPDGEAASADELEPVAEAEPVDEEEPVPESESVPEPEPIESAPPRQTRVQSNGGHPTDAALRAELEQRAATEAQLRGQLAAARGELDVRGAHQAELESTQAELRAELDELVALIEQDAARRADVESKAVILAAEAAELHERVNELTAARDDVAAEAERLRAEFAEVRMAAEQQSAERVLFQARTDELSDQLTSLRAELATSEVGRESAVSEATGLRAELDRLGAELAHVRGSNNAGKGLSEAQALLVEARAVTARLRERSTATEAG
jgi:hypothetical protein